MEVQHKNASLTPKKAAKPKFQIRAVFVALILKFQSVISLEEKKSTFPLKIYLRSLRGPELSAFLLLIF